MAMSGFYPERGPNEFRDLIKREIASRMDVALKAMEERFQQMEERGTVGPQDVRMSCIHLAKDAGCSDATTIIKMAERLSAYVLTGKKAVETQATAPTHGQMGLLVNQFDQSEPGDIIEMYPFAFEVRELGREKVLALVPDFHAVKKPGEA